MAFYEAQIIDFGFEPEDTIIGVQPFSAVASIQGTPQLQVPLQSMEAVATLSCSDIFVGVVIDCPPFVATASMPAASLHHQLACPPFSAEAFVQAAPQIQVPVEPFRASAALSIENVLSLNVLSCPPFVATASLSMESLQRQLACPPFLATASIQAAPQIQIPVPALTASASLSVQDILRVRILDCPPFMAAASMSAPGLQHQLSCPPFRAVGLMTAPNLFHQLYCPPLQAFALFSPRCSVWDGTAWKKWLLENYAKTVRRYAFTLTGDVDGTTDIEIPITSFQCRRRSGAPTYLSVVIRDLSFADAIRARANGDMRVEMIYDLYGVEVYRNALASVHLENIRIDRGGARSSISLIGHQQYSYAGKNIEMQDLVYTQFKDGQYRYRCSIPNLYLNPGDVVVDGETTFTADEIQYIVDVAEQSMEVRGV